MKTITEFPGVVLRQIIKSKQELISGGTAEDQLATAIGESYKIEGDRLTHLMKAVSLVGENSERVSRVRVFAQQEGADESKLPKGIVEEGEHLYLVEMFS